MVRSGLVIWVRASNIDIQYIYIYKLKELVLKKKRINPQNKLVTCHSTESTRKF
jgi:hypothetical protein